LQILKGVISKKKNNNKNRKY